MPVTRKKQKFMDLIERIMVRWGYTHTDGRIYGILGISDRPLTIDEIAEETGLSRSSVSTSLNRLLKDYMITVKKKGRVKYFSIIPSFLEKFLEQPRELLEKEVLPLMQITEKLAAKSENEEYHMKLEDLLKNLESLKCVLNRIIMMEEGEFDCVDE